jgi:hypothetical protein
MGMSGPVDQVVTRSRWLDWTPQAPILAEPLRNEPAKPSKPGFAGFAGSDQGDSSKIAAGSSPAIESDFISLRNGPTLPVSALLLALNLEARGFTMTLDQALQFVITPVEALTPIDVSAIAKWRLHLGTIIHYALEVRTAHAGEEG